MTTKHHGTSGGVELTDDVLDDLADEAERGYDRDQLGPRRRGRPPMGRAAASVFQVRLEPSLRHALRRRADREGTTASDVARAALREYLRVS